MSFSEELQMIQHHPFGPSVLAHLDPRPPRLKKIGVQGCSAYLPAESSDSEAAEKGSLNHRVFQSGDFSLLEGDVAAEQKVRLALKQIGDLSEGNGFDAAANFEVRLELKGINFGTCDYLRFNAAGSKALLVDLKFGVWSVAPARDNLQLLNYVAAAFGRFEHLKRILGVIWQNGHISTRWFNRRFLPRYIERVKQIVFRAQNARDNPKLTDFTPDPVNCSFCERLNCPARIQLASALVSAWVKTPTTIPQGFSLTRVDLETLQALKRLCGALNTFIKAVNSEAKRRVFDEGAILSGYEIRQRSGERVLTGETKVETAIAVLDRFWRERYPQIPLVVADIVLGIVELSVTEIEKQIARHAPKGQVITVQRAVGEALENAGLVESLPQFYLAAIKE